MVLRRRIEDEESKKQPEPRRSTVRALEGWWAAQGSPCHLHGLRTAALPPPWAAHGLVASWAAHGKSQVGLWGVTPMGWAEGCAIGRWAM